MKRFRPLAKRAITNQVVRSGNLSLEIVLEESDESVFWLEIVAEKQWISNPLVERLHQEANELTAVSKHHLKL